MTENDEWQKLDEFERLANRHALRDYMRTGEVQLETREMFRTAFWVKTKLLLRAYSPDQSRIPAGQPGGGQWAPEAGSNTGDNPENNSPIDNQNNDLIEGGNGKTRQSISVIDEDSKGGHIYEMHVNKSDDWMLNRIKQSREGLFGGIGLESTSSFYSLPSANRLINSTTDDPINLPMVNAISEGKLPIGAITSEFGSVTGTEYFASSHRSEPVRRETTRVRVILVYDPNSYNGYRVLTAFPKY